MGDAEPIVPAEISMTEEQREDFALLLAKYLGRGNIEWLANSALGPEAVQQAGNDVTDVKAFAVKIVQALHEAGRIPHTMALLLKESHRNGMLALGVNYIRSGQRLNTDAALQAFVNEYEPFLGSAEIMDLLPRITRTVCAVALGDPIYEIRGSGFLIGPDVVMTNFHVVEPFLKVDLPTKTVQQHGPGKEILFYFDYLSAPAPNPRTGASHTAVAVTAAEKWLLQAREKLAGDGSTISPRVVNKEYDYAVIKLQRPVGTQSARSGGGEIRGWLTPEDVIDVLVAQKRILVFQHPQMSPQQFDVGDFVQLDPSSTRVWYSVSTAHGSSGGAAVGTDGRLFALHNAEVKAAVPAAGGKRVNQGVRIDLIAKDLAAVVPKVPMPEENSILFWSLNDDFKNPRPIIGRAAFRNMVTQMGEQNSERILVVTGPPASGLQFSIKLLRRTLGMHVPVVVFKASDLQKLGPQDFLRVLVDELGLLGLSGTEMPELPSTENVPRWLRLDLPKWLRECLIKDQERSPTKYPAWVVINTVVPADQRLLWADNLKDFVAALAGAHDAGQAYVDLPQLRWLFLALTPDSLPVSGLKQLEEDLGKNNSYNADFAECFLRAYRSVNKQASLHEPLLKKMAGLTLQLNQKLPPDQKLPPRKALADAVCKLINNDPDAGGGN